MLRDFDGIDSSVTAMWLKGDDHAGLEATGLLIPQILLTSATKSFEIKLYDRHLAVVESQNYQGM